MDAIDCLLTRNSARLLAEPAPKPEELTQILQTAVSAPDHGRLRPWRFVVINNVDRDRFGDIMADSARRSQPDAEGKIERARKNAFRAPLIVVVAARTDATDEGIPEIEQILAVGAAAQNIMLAAHALGYGAMWKTGAVAYDEEAKLALGLHPQDHIVGFMYIGTRNPADEALPRATLESVVLDLPN
jgi:nitroreductase